MQQWLSLSCIFAVQCSAVRLRLYVCRCQHAHPPCPLRIPPTPLHPSSCPPQVLDKVIQVRDKQLSVLKVAGPAVYKSPDDSAVNMEGRAGSSSSANAPQLLPPQEQQAVTSAAAGQGMQGSASENIAAIERSAASMSGDALQVAANAGGNSRLIESAADVRSVSAQAAAAVVAVANAMADLQMSSARRRGPTTPSHPGMDSKQLAETLTAAGVGSGGLSVWCAPERSSSGDLQSSGSGGLVGNPDSGGRARGARSTASSRSRGVSGGAGGGVSLQGQGSLPLLQEQPSGGSAGSWEHHSAMSDLEQRLAAMPQLTAMFKDMPLVEGVRHWKWMLARVSGVWCVCIQEVRSSKPGCHSHLTA